MGMEVACAELILVRVCRLYQLSVNTGYDASYSVQTQEVDVSKNIGQQ